MKVKTKGKSTDAEIVYKLHKIAGRLDGLGRHHRRGQPGAQLLDRSSTRSSPSKAYDELIKKMKSKLENGGRPESGRLGARRCALAARRRLHASRRTTGARPTPIPLALARRRAHRAPPPSTSVPSPFPVVIDTGTPHHRLRRRRHADGGEATRRRDLSGCSTPTARRCRGSTSTTCSCSRRRSARSASAPGGAGRRRARRRQPVALRGRASTIAARRRR